MNEACAAGGSLLQAKEFQAKCRIDYHGIVEETGRVYFQVNAISLKCTRMCETCSPTKTVLTGEEHQASPLVS